MDSAGDYIEQIVKILQKADNKKLRIIYHFIKNLLG